MGHYRFDPNSINFDEIFENQYGSGSYYYEGFPFQRGYGYRGDGMGSIFRHILNQFIIPLAKKGGKAVGKEALISAGRIIDNIVQGGDVADTIKNETKSGVKRLAARVAQSGSGVVQTGGGSPAKKRKMSKRKRAKKQPVKRKTKKRKKIVGKLKKKNISSLFKTRTKLGFY